MHTISLQNRSFQYEIRRKAIHSLRLRLLSSDSFYVSCHYLIPTSTVIHFIQDHSDWIIKNSSKIKPKVHIDPVELARFKTHALSLITAELQKLSQTYHFSYGRVSVRNQKTRLGSCSHSGNLSFNWQIVLFPPALFRHVLLHELVHLTIKNHSPRFWAALAVYDPNWRQNRKRLKSQPQFR